MILFDCMIPKKLKKGSRVAVIAPSRSLSIINKETREIALERLKKLGIEVELSKHAGETDEFDSSSIKSRIEDLNWAFGDKEIDGILTVIGGFNSNQLLKYMDYGLIKRNPKILCGYSDITALQNAIRAKTGLVTYYGPHFSSLGMKKGADYTLEYFRACLFSSEPFSVKPSEKWSDDRWFIDQEKREFMPNDGYSVINQGNAEGKIVGGNLCTLNLLQGTEFMPEIKDSVLFLEDDAGTRPQIFDRDLQSLMHLPDFDTVKGVVIGRFPKASLVTPALLAKVIKAKKELDDIPVIANVDFGHTNPQITFPIGGSTRLIAENKGIELKITEH